MGEVVNLRRARKAAGRAKASAEADAARARHGRTTAEKARDAGEAARLAAVLDGAKREG